MIFNKYKKKVKNTKREYCDIPEDDNKEKTVLSDVVTNENSFKNIILKNYFKIILKNIYNNFYKNNYFFEIVLYVDIIQIIDSGLYDDCQITTNFITFTKNFNKNVYILFSDFLESFRSENDKKDFINYLDILLKNKFFTIILVPINTPIKTDCITNLSKSNKLEKNIYEVIELINATLIRKDKKSFLYKTFYMRICDCSHKYMPYQNIIVKTFKLGGVNKSNKYKGKCALCFTKEYEEIIIKRKFKNFFILTFSFTKEMDEYNSKDECITFDVLYHDVSEKNKLFENGLKYNLIVVPIPDELRKNGSKGAHTNTLWLLNYRGHEINKFEIGKLVLSRNLNPSLLMQKFNCFIKDQTLCDMKNIIFNILKIPSDNFCLSKICKTTKLSLILISISSNFLKYSKLDISACHIFNKINIGKSVNSCNIKGHPLKRLRGPHCFFICSDEIIMTEIVKFCNYFCNIKILNVKVDSFSILLTQKYDILVININNFSSSQIDALEEILKNGVYKNKKDSVPISTTFWVYAAKPYIRNEYEFNTYIKGNLLARFDFLFDLNFGNDDEIIDEILRMTDNDEEKKTFDYYFDLNNEYNYLKKGNFPNYEFTEMSDISESIIQKYFHMASDLSTLTIHHIGICELLCISISILLRKKECSIEHVALGLFLYDRFVSSTKNKLTQFDKNILNNIINSKSDEDNSFYKLMNYFSSYLSATINL
ncbi:conserved Plasmodium protein, unknown function [Plasmodium berghei]|uniref:Uncharacterized protein n=2 Tax=Plasmodium berghei TaxID=5821 RepID=A0A509AGK0_PLABA|nr:conserved Plasmodium protein, unknown function [Plasmodium berghei ANKA]CXI12289.1 conserved Plasmodium protein, unknown function [Plasmodium berghei]SCL93339.1 conserved Plasmodium protein, unknown function [Plasmodium berghei]SCM15838.1 conserved Plasmodium protein, unknown function [Plasmodium berghei]SCM17633.1 conserved Plasmodium protein, unknown function [Plasmodium berghei]SCN23145.1 conserved Plasmodium protein, unknown function [Plasmodium berghei]|eukprot:XP_034420442.1 conserved Plasmodium protein, unknown function [Plasmodium berghei ANKA]